MVVFYNSQRAPPASFIPFCHIQVKEEQATLLQTCMYISEDVAQIFQAHNAKLSKVDPIVKTKHRLI